jgi:hypothetical protein
MAPLEFEALQIARRLLESARETGIGIPRVVCVDEEITIQQDVQDYLFLYNEEPKVWSWQGLRIDEESWSIHVCGVEME